MENDFYEIESFRPCVSLGYLLRRLDKLGANRIERAFDGSDITFTQWAVLALIWASTADTCSGLARNLDHDAGAMTRVLDQLEERGYIVRTRDPADRRVTKLTLPDAGYKMLVKLAATVVDEWNMILSVFAREEIVQLINTLTKLLQRMEALEEEEGRA